MGKGHQHSSVCPPALIIMQQKTGSAPTPSAKRARKKIAKQPHARNLPRKRGFWSITSSAIFSAPHGAIMSSFSRCLPAKRPSFPTCSTATVFQAFMRTQMRAIFFFFFFDFYLLFCNEPKKNPSSFGAPKASSRALRGRPIPPRADIDDQTTSFSILLHRSALDTTCTKTIMGLFFL